MNIVIISKNIVVHTLDIVRQNRIAKQRSKEIPSQKVEQKRPSTGGPKSDQIGPFGSVRYGPIRIYRT